MAPYINHRKEHESLINEYRIALGLTHKELAAQSKVQSATICALASGMLSPIKENGSAQLRTAAKKLCEFFEVGPEDLFPRYICSLNRTHKFDIQPYETWSERAADNCGEQFAAHDFAWFLIKTGLADATPREIRVFLAVLFYDETFSAIAHREGVTPSRISESFSKSFRRITAAAQKTGLPINTKNRGWTVRQRLG